MDTIWAPWRISYLKNVDEKKSGCIFCTKPAETCDRDNLILHRGKFCFVILNKFPYNNGHAMVVPYIHTAQTTDLCNETVLEMWHFVNQIKAALQKAFHPDGFNIGMNLNRTAGAGIDDHIHMHVVPRWNGDNNFMPVIGQTKVISQSLEDTFGDLKPYFT